MHPFLFTELLCFTGQSYVFFFQLWKAGQHGHVTRIVSGCQNAEEEQAIRSIFEKEIRLGIPTGRDRFHIHVTPDYSRVVPNVHYKPLNKPYGVVHWMENALAMPSNLTQYADTMFIVLDPDQILLRPFTTRDFGQDVMRLNWLTKAKRHVLKEGHPISQFYAFGGYWVNDVNKERQLVIDTAWSTIKDNPAFSDSIKTSSHLYNWTAEEINERYAAGPPYIALGPDMYRISVLWAGVAVPVYELTNNHVSEMFMYSTAAAHLEMPHDLAYDFMFSNPEADGYEIWQHVDEMPVKDLCKHTISDNSDPLNVKYRNRLPYIFHYCQEYYHGPYYFFKYFLPEDFLSCGHPLLQDPADHDAEDSPFVLAISYNSTKYKTYDGRPPTVTFPHRLRHTFSLCHLISRVNEAARYWKEQFCTPETANFNKLFTIQPQ
jgi:peptidyl serine alpha-galactosyltransferase